MEHLNWELAVLSRAVAYPNLSGAAGQIGISQPQLSRIIAKLERELRVHLLDRDSRRNSSWTQAAFRVAELYARTARQFVNEVQRLSDPGEPEHLHVACLEGLISLAMDLCARIAKDTSVNVIELNALDLSALEEAYLKIQYDLILTSREPGNRKPHFAKHLGYQTLTLSGREADATVGRVYSTYEYATERPAKGEGKVLISNSLAIRQTWIERYGGRGHTPSEVRKRKSLQPSEVNVLLIGNDHLPPPFWARIAEFL